MSTIHDALTALSPTPFSSLPPTPEELAPYLHTTLTHTHTVLSSLPTPTSAPTPLSNEWKPLKLSPKDNPLSISVYKLPSPSGNGTWFARRSIHDTLSFRRFRDALRRELDEGERHGKSIRGIGRERCVHRLECDVGTAEVNYLTAQFPGPSAPRDFVSATLTSSAHPDDLVEGGAETGKAVVGRPRQFTMVSRPLRDHPECGERQGYVRGQFESVEFIRELPGAAAREGVRRAMSSPSLVECELEEARAGRKRGRTVGFADLEGEDHAVEWIMVTRSDPGGSVPRWMVERGTPGGIIKDAEKFLEWAAGREELNVEGDRYRESVDGAVWQEEEGTVPEEERRVQEEERRVEGERRVEEERNLEEEVPDTQPEKPPTGLVVSAVSAISKITPSIISSTSNPESSASTSTAPLPPTRTTAPPSPSPTPTPSLSSTASLASFATAPSPTPSRTSSLSPSITHPRTPEEKALARLLREKAKLAEKLARQRSKERKKRSKDDEREQKLLEKHMREVEKREARYGREIEKARKREEKKSAKQTKEQREVEELRSVVEGLTRDNLRLRERVEALERRETEGHIG